MNLARCNHGYVLLPAVPAQTRLRSSCAIAQQTLFHFLLRIGTALRQVAQTLFQFLPNAERVHGVVEGGLFGQVVGDIVDNLFDGLHGRAPDEAS